MLYAESLNTVPWPGRDDVFFQHKTFTSVIFNRMNRFLDEYEVFPFGVVYDDGYSLKLAERIDEMIRVPGGTLDLWSRAETIGEESSEEEARAIWEETRLWVRSYDDFALMRQAWARWQLWATSCVKQSRITKFFGAQ
jgi:hypothetical protein